MVLKMARPCEGASDVSMTDFNSLGQFDWNIKPENLAKEAEVPVSSVPTSTRKVPNTNRGRVDIIRQKAGRGGKTVTVVANFTGIGLPEKEKLAKEIQKSCGTGGTVKDGKIEIQGDKREEVARILTAAGFRPVFAGG